MNTSIQKTTPSRRSFAVFLVVFAALACLLTQPLLAADESAIAQKAEEAAREKAAAAKQEAKDFWQQIDAARLKNRTPDELVAFVIMGVLVAGVAGMMTSLKPTGAGLLGRLALGLAGAFLGGIIVHVRNFDFGWGPVLIRYEELLFSFVGGALIVLLPKIIKWRFKKKALTR